MVKRSSTTGSDTWSDVDSSGVGVGVEGDPSEPHPTDTKTSTVRIGRPSSHQHPRGASCGPGRWTPRRIVLASASVDKQDSRNRRCRRPRAPARLVDLASDIVRPPAYAVLLNSRPIAQTEPFAVRNGRTNATFTVTPISTLRCPGGQVARITSFDVHPGPHVSGRRAAYVQQLEIEPRLRGDGTGLSAPALSIWSPLAHDSGEAVMSTRPLHSGPLGRSNTVRWAREIAERVGALWAGRLVLRRLGRTD